MPVLTITGGPLQANCHLAWPDGGSRALVVDAGGDADDIAAALAERSLDPDVLFSTHGHVDHVAANAELKARFPAMTLAIMREERGTLMRPTHNLSLFVGGAIEPPEPELLLGDGDTLEAGGLSFRAIHVPGHAERDTLFAGGIGRSDFPGGDPAALVRAIRERLLTLPGDTVLYSGHGPETTVAAELATNPFVTG